MNHKITANGLTLIRIPSTGEPLGIIGDFENTIAEHITMSSLFVAYMDYRVIIGRYENGGFIFYQETEDEIINPQYLQRIRVFNAEEELLLWRTQERLRGRLRRDNIGDDVDVVEATQVLFGTKSEPLGDEQFTQTLEARGTRLLLPFPGLHVDDRKERIFVKTRNYIDYTNAHQATYVDCRFVGFTDKNGELY